MSLNPSDEAPRETSPSQRHSECEGSFGAGLEYEDDEDWPRVATHLQKMLRAKGCSAADADDIVQDVALRLLVHRADHGQPDHVLAWSRTVASRLHLDLIRAATRRPTISSEVLLDCPHWGNLSEQLEHRTALDAVLAVLQVLIPAELQLLNSAHAGRTGRPPADKVRRFRLRQRLKAATAGLLAVGLVLFGAAVTHRHTASGLGPKQTERLAQPRPIVRSQGLVHRP